MVHSIQTLWVIFSCIYTVSCVQEWFVSMFRRNVLPLHLDCLLSLCVHTGLLDLWTLCPQRTFYSGSLGGGGMGEVCRTVPKLHIPWCGEISFKFMESILLNCIFCLLCYIFCSSKFIKTSEVSHILNFQYIKNLLVQTRFRNKIFFIQIMISDYDSKSLKFIYGVFFRVGWILGSIHW